MPRPAPSFHPLLLLALAAAPLFSARAADEATAWELVARHLPADALAQLGSPQTEGTREVKFTRAVVLMDSQPITAERLQQAAAELTELARGNDEIACTSGYLLGRLYQVHFPTPDPTRAAHEFERLAQQHPQSYWAQLGLVKLSLLVLYVLPEPADTAARVAEAETLLPRLTDPALQRDLHIVLGRARLFHGLPGVLPHLLAAERIGGLSNVPRAELQLQIAELSRRAGDWEQARELFQRFLDENEVDARAYQVKLKLADVHTHLRADKAGPP